MCKDLPQFLYKYRSISDEILYVRQEDGSHKFVDNGLDALSKGMVWFSHLDKLNDPYENVYDFDDSDYFRDLNQYLSTYPKPTTPQEIAKKANVDAFIASQRSAGKSDCEIITALERLSSPSLKVQLVDIRRQIRSDKSNKTGILSLCKTNDNLLMWAYYAGEHKGFCLEFSTTDKHAGNNILCDGRYTFPVTYGKNYLTLKDVNPFYSSTTPNPMTDMAEMAKSIEKVYCHKSLEWDREEEWRVVLDITGSKKKTDASGALIPFPGKLTTVYFGCRATQMSIDAVKEAVKIGNYGYTTEFKKARLKTDSFGLDFDPV